MKTRGKTYNEINITPLTDIFLVLLIIMMVTAPMIDIKGLELAVVTVGPSTASDEKPKTILVEINSQGEYTVAGEMINHDQLEPKITQQAAQNPDGVIIEVNPDSAHEATAYALAAAKKAGVTKIAITAKEATQTKDIAPPPAQKHKK
jgi:biopolymer transport protein ExbD